MNFHEYQAKQLFADYGIPVPAGRVASTADEAVEAAKSLGDGPWTVSYTHLTLPTKRIV